jgi:hypothetical protein
MDLAFGFIESCCRCTLISPEPEVNGRARTHTEGTCCKQVFSGASTEPATHALARTENMIASSWLIICVIFKLEITQLEMGFYFYLCALLEPFICTRTHFDTHTHKHEIYFVYYYLSKTSRATRGANVCSRGNDKLRTVD